MTIPRFAIVGHPNKGKSSIVATLAQDENVAISLLPGTTTEDRVYPMQVDGETIYELVDTPGFQRAREAYEWMRNQVGSSAERPDIVRRFATEHRNDSRFDAERSLLKPILEGAGILYVVDGSRPFGSEYEAEMEILRWSGQPSMALINMVGANDYRRDWEIALGQYFRIVRVFDAMTADFDRRLQLLLAFAQLRDEWRQPLEKAAAILRDLHGQRRQQAAQTIAETIARMITYQRRRPIRGESISDEEKSALQKSYHDKLIELEEKCRSRIEKIYHHRRIDRKEAKFQILDEDLFAKETWQIFGLTQQQLVTTGTVGGAAAGGVIDIAAGGSSLLLGAGLGAIVGGASAWLTADRMADIKILGLPLGGKELRVGPMRNVNFPYVALGRALLHQRLIEERTHACRAPLKITPQSRTIQSLSTDTRRRLEKVFHRLRKQAAATPELVNALAREIDQIISSRDKKQLTSLNTLPSG